jgi:hypothetical protein
MKWLDKIDGEVAELVGVTALLSALVILIAATVFRWDAVFRFFGIAIPVVVIAALALLIMKKLQNKRNNHK